MVMCEEVLESYPLRCDIYRRWDLETSRDVIIAEMLDVLRWEAANYSEETMPIVGLHVGNFVCLPQEGIWARKYTLSSPESSEFVFWRVLLKCNRGYFIFEFHHSGSEPLKYLHTLRRWVSGGSYRDIMRHQEDVYRSRLRGRTSRVFRNINLEATAAPDVCIPALANACAVVCAEVCAEYFSVLSMVNFFGLMSTFRVPMDAGSSSLDGLDFFMEKVCPLFYSTYSELRLGTHPEEVMMMLRFLRLMYESVYRRFNKAFGVHSIDNLESAMSKFTDAFMESLLINLRSTSVEWGNSLSPVILNFLPSNE